MIYYRFHRKNGKNARYLYYLQNIWRMIVSAGLWRGGRLRRALRDAEQREDAAYIRDRVDYYNKLQTSTDVGAEAQRLADFRLRDNHSMYWFDAYEYARWFPRKFKWNYIFGDVVHIPSVPTIVKSRPIAGDNANSVLLNLDKLRHFTFLDDRIPFGDKQDRAIFRGDVSGKQNRLRFMELYGGHPLCDVAAGGGLTLWDHLRFKFILALEGNDVASNLKWIMSSNSVAVMPEPTYETWFMEGRLEPDFHYIRIRPDFSDFEQRIAYYIQHPAEAEAIARNANAYVRQFLNPARERLISLCVLQKYFCATAQAL